jgi:hypothetical protein
MLYRYVNQDIALEEQNPCVAGSTAIANFLDLHLRLNVIGERPKGPGSIAEAGSFDLHLAPIAAVGGAFHISEAIFFQHRRVGRISRCRIFGGFHALGVDAPAAEGLRQRTGGSLGLSRRNRRQHKNDGEETQTRRLKESRNHHCY